MTETREKKPTRFAVSTTQKDAHMQFCNQSLEASVKSSKL